VFVSPNSSSAAGKTLSNVEGFVMSYYEEKGFVGVHDEGSSVATLFVLLFWDVLFMDVSGAFLSSYQVG